MKKYKIAFIISHPIQYMSPLFKKIAEYNEIDLTVFYCSEESLKPKKDIGFGIEIIWDIPLYNGYKYKFFKNFSPIPTIFKPPFGLINFGIIKEILGNKYDAIIIHGWHYATYWLAYITAVLTKIPIFIRADSPLNQELLKPKWKIFIKKILFATLFKGATMFLAVGTENKEFYKFYGIEEKKIILVRWAVDNDRFIKDYNKLIPDKEKIKKELDISSDKVIVLFCGKLTDKKRPMDLLMAYEKTNLPNKALVYVGDGYLRKNLEGYVIKNNIKDVYFARFKNQTELPKYYVIADIFVLPSTMGETWGLVVNEAMCFHLPIVVSDLVGCGKDLVKHDENGFIFKVGDIEVLKKYLEKLIENEELRVAMGNKSFEIVKSWNYETDAEKIIEALRGSL